MSSSRNIVVEERSETPAAKPHNVETDTLALQRLRITSAAIGRAWNDAIDAGVAQLPELSPRHALMLDGLTFVTEMRVGNEYRASQIEDAATPIPPLRPT